MADDARKDKRKQKKQKVNDNVNDSMTSNKESDCEEKEIISILKLLVKQAEENTKIMQNMATSTMKESFEVRFGSVSRDVFDLSTRVDALEKENKRLHKCLEESNAKNKILEKQLEESKDEIDEVEQYVRRSCLVINNLPSESNKTDEQVFLGMCEDKFKEKFTVTSDMISKIHRVPRPPSSQVDRSKPHSLVVKFNKDRHRDMIFKNKREMKGSGITITELLTSKRSALLKQCIDKIPGGPNRAVWTDNGRIYAKYSKDSHQSHSLQIKTASDIDKFINEITHLLPGPAAAAAAGTA